MAYRDLKGNHILLRVFLGESDRDGHELLYLSIMKKAREMGLAGCTVLRGIAGFGASSVIHSDFPVEFSRDLPIVIEVSDTRERTRRFLKAVEPMLSGALVTEEKIRVIHYRHAPKKPPRPRAPRR